MFHVTIFNNASGESEGKNFDSFKGVLEELDNHTPEAINFTFYVQPYWPKDVDIEGLE